MNLTEILKDSNYKLSQFSANKIEAFENSIYVEYDKKGIEIPYIECLVRRKKIKLTPEEAVRQLYLMVLNEDYGYSYERMELEYAVSFGREKKRADIVIFDKIDSRAVNIIVEVKKPPATARILSRGSINNPLHDVSQLRARNTTTIKIPLGMIYL